MSGSLEQVSLASFLFLYETQKKYNSVRKQKRRSSMQKLEQLYKGKAKKVFLTENSYILIVGYKDDATAFNGGKKGNTE